MGTQPGPTTAPAAWGPARRLLFRFVFAYLVLYNLPFPLTALPYTAEAAEPYQQLWHAAVPWVGEHVFGVTITVRPNGSGDTTYNYVQVFCFAVLAAAAAAAWTLLDRRRPDYARLHGWLRVYIRFALASAMILYGSVKVIKAQFPDPPLDRLLQPFGDASPMGLLWTFMGASGPYNVFTGAGELLGGLLLTTRRTTLLGALVSIGVLSHVVALNFCYDVPVKLFSLHLLAMAVFLAAPDLPRLANLFLLGRPAAAAPLRPLFRRRWLDVGVRVLRTALVALFVGVSLHGAHQARQMFGDLSARSPLRGVWAVEEFVADGRERPPLVTDASRWRRVVFDYPNSLAVQLMSDSRVRYGLALDTEAKTLKLTKRDDPGWSATVTYEGPEPGVLALEGALDGRAVRARLRRAEASEFLLVSRGFHWINEYPFNR
jgi:hypothetical protein